MTTPTTAPIQPRDTPHPRPTPPNSTQWATRSAHLNGCAERPLIRRRASVILTAGLWLQVDEDRGSQQAPPAACYRYSTDRNAEHPPLHLKDLNGFMHADGYAGFKDIFRAGSITEVTCMAHIRPKFVDVHESQGSAIAEEALRRIPGLYAVEKKARGSPPHARVRLRQDESEPILDDLKA